MDSKTYLGIWKQLTEELSAVRDISNSRPLLAHYTSMHVIESLLKTRQMWLSNPLNMNDYQEVRHGIHLALSELQIDPALRDAFADDELYFAFLGEIEVLYHDYGVREVKNLYVTCFSEHSFEELPDGKLSMWRGYGDQGNGAAIIIDTEKANIKAGTPFRLAEVTYMSDEQRREKTREKIHVLAEIVENGEFKPDDLPGLAHVFFRRVVLAAVFTKHIGFEEEDEWRLAYFPDDDHEHKYASMIDYHVSPVGLEPKLKLQLDGTGDVDSLGLHLEEVVSGILLGPRSKTPLSEHAAIIMLQKLGYEALIPKLSASSIPFRG